MRPNRLLCVFWIGWVLCAPGLTAQTLESLQAEDHARIDAWIEPKSDLVPGQQLRLIVEVLTDTWFSAGTRFNPPEVEDAIVLRREKFATNLNRRDGQHNWVGQRFEMTIYPQRSGAYRIPPIPLQVTVAGDGGKRISGTLISPAVQFAVDWPEPLRSVDEWVATPSFVVEQQFDRPLDGLQPGDAIRQTIRYVALDVPAMMLPEYTSYALDGIAVYRQTPTVRDQVDRGVYRAERIEQLTWVIEAGGEYAIPPREYAWWDTTQQQLKLITLPGFSLQAGLPDAETTPSEVDDGWREVTQSASRPIALALIALALAVLIWIRRRRMVVEASDARSTTTLDWRKRFQRAVADQDVTLMVSTLYAWYDHQVTDFDGCLRPYLAVAARDEARVALEQLLVAAFAAESGTLPAHSAVRALCINNDRMPVAGSTAYAVDADLR